MAFQDYRYQPKTDYDRQLRINGEKVSLYSKEKLAALYPNKDYTVRGETWEKKKRDKARDVGRLDIAQKWLYVSENGRHKKFFRKPVAYAEVEGGGFIALLKLRLLPFILLLALLLVGAGITYFALNYEKPVDPNEQDPNIVTATEWLYGISGTVTRNGEAVSDASLSLQSGNSELVAVNTDENGAYLFADVDVGVYNVVCTAGNSILTKPADIVGESVIVDFAFPESDVKATIKIADEDTPAIVANGLSDEALLQAVTGKEVDITLLVDRLTDAEVPAEEKASIEEISGELVMTYYDFRMLKEVYQDKALESSEYLSNTKAVLEIAVPFDSSESVGTYAFRCHGGAAARLEQLSARPAGDYTDGTYYATIDTVYIYTNRFSTYAIGCADVGATAQGSDMIIFSDGATVNVKSRKVSMYYSHGASATHNARVEIYLVGREENLLVAQSGIIPPGNELSVMQLYAKASELPSDASYEGLMRIIYLGTDGKTADTNVELPITVTIAR